MIICIVIDDHNGLMNKGRRLSQDRELRKDILKEAGENPLWMNTYSARQFEHPLAEQIRIDEDFLDKAGAGEYCFVENLQLIDYIGEIEKIILYQWNRTYPSDMQMDFHPSEMDLQLERSCDFSGVMHPKITKEVWG